MELIKKLPRKFKEVESGKWEQPVRKGYLMQCCDCGLIHSFDFRIYRGRVQYRAYRIEVCKCSAKDAAVCESMPEHQPEYCRVKALKTSKPTAGEGPIPSELAQRDKA